jgi:hypothetical protein
MNLGYKVGSLIKMEKEKLKGMKTSELLDLSYEEQKNNEDYDWVVKDG